MSFEGFPVEAGSILTFRRSIGDSDPDMRVPPLTYVQVAAQFTPEYPLRPKPGEKWFGSGRQASGMPPPAEGDPVIFHAEQHYEYHRPYGPGDVLAAMETVGEKWEKDGRSGRLVFTPTTTEYTNQRGELVVTARSVWVESYRDGL